MAHHSIPDRFAAAAEHGVEVALIAELLERHGLRVGEVLGLRAEDISDDELIFIAGSKGSNDRTLYDPAGVASLQALRPGLTSGRFFRVSYHQVYHHFKREGVGSHPPGATNLRITHHFRAALIHQLLEDGWSHEDVSAFIGHKSTDTLEFYLE